MKVRVVPFAFILRTWTAIKADEADGISLLLRPLGRDSNRNVKHVADARGYMTRLF